MQNKIVNLGQVRDLLSEWERVKDEIRAGRIEGFALMVRAPNGGEAIYVGGHYKSNPHEATRCVLRLSAALVMVEDPPLVANEL